MAGFTLSGKKSLSIIGTHTYELTAFSTARSAEICKKGEELFTYHWRGGQWV